MNSAIRKMLIDRAVRDSQIAFHTLPEGAVEPSHIQAAATALMVALQILGKRGAPPNLAHSTMLGAMSALADCANRQFVWRAADAMVVDDGLRRAKTVIFNAKPAEAVSAWDVIGRA